MSAGDGGCSPSVVHISHADGGGGAARGAYTLHSALRKLGVTSQLVVARKTGSDPAVHGPHGPIRKHLAAANTRFEDSLPRLIGRPSDIFTINVFGSTAITRARRFTPDLVHLHWVGYGTLRPGQMAGLDMPIVWTLRDMWPLTGGCHYDHGCGRFRSRCGSCPVLGSHREWDVSTWGQRRKIQAFSEGNIYLVALSNWLANQTRESRTTAGLPIRVIPPGIDLDVFKPVDPAAARSLLGLPDRGQIIFFPAINPLEHRKGWKPLLASLRLIADQLPGADAMTLLVSGAASLKSLSESPIRPVALGTIDDDRRMAAAYSAADVTVVPSLQEAFGKVSVESLACRTPVVAFRGTGLEDAIRHEVTGYLAEHGSPADLAGGILWTLDLKRSAGFVSELERERPRYSAMREARSYLDLYEEIAANGDL